MKTLVVLKTPFIVVIIFKKFEVDWDVSLRI